MVRTLFRLLTIWRDAKAASNGPAALGRRVVRRQAHRSLSRSMRRHHL